MKQNGRKMRPTGALAWGFIGLMLMVSSGCVDLTGRPADPVQSAVVTGHRGGYEYQGHAFGMRGFLGVFSLGIDGLAHHLNHDHIIQAAAIADHSKGQFQHILLRDYRKHLMHGPLILYGHSWGADDQIRVARALGRRGISVQLLVLVDPVTPPRIPPNVQRCIDIYKSHPDTDWMPIWRGVPVKVKDVYRTRLTDINLRYADVGFPTKNLTHATIIDSPGVQKMMLHAILNTCKRWQARHPKINMAIRGRTQDKMTKVSHNSSP
jgi:pimeloyl-ACP methyl ester carboxylesterase